MVDVQGSGQNFQPQWNVLCFPAEGLSQAIFSGPDGLADYRAHRLVDTRPIGTNPYSSEATSGTDYLWRAPPPIHPGVPVHLRPRSTFAGEIGWHYYRLRPSYPEPTWTGHQVLTSEFRRQLEDLPTHRYQNPWYPGEGEEADPAREGAYFRKFPHTGQPRPSGHESSTHHEHKHPHGTGHDHSRKKEEHHEHPACSEGFSPGSDPVS